ncbi:MAG: Fic family protein [bacterium]
MPIKFEPHYIITPKIANYLMRIEAAKGQIGSLPLTPTVLASLRETARLYTTHYSTMIEGNALSPDQVKKILKHKGHFPGRERDEKEVKGYYAALAQVEQWVSTGTKVTEKTAQTLHALVMSNGKTKIKPSLYRDGQNAIYDGRTRALVYMPPETKDVLGLMQGMVTWIGKNIDLPCPIVAGIVHYQFTTMHPYYDGNGRTARLLTTMVLHLGGYDLKGLYSLEEYYARNLDAYYEAISVGNSHNYYMGRAEANITKWIEYFVEGMAIACENVLRRMAEANIKGSHDQGMLIRKLDPKQRKVLELFQEFVTVTAGQIGALFGFRPRTSAQICATWVASGFLKVADTSNKGRKYKLSKQYEALMS